VFLLRSSDTKTDGILSSPFLQREFLKKELLYVAPTERELGSFPVYAARPLPSPPSPLTPSLPPRRYCKDPVTKKNVLVATKKATCQDFDVFESILRIMFDPWAMTKMVESSDRWSAGASSSPPDVYGDYEHGTNFREHELLKVPFDKTKVCASLPPPTCPYLLCRELLLTDRHPLVGPDRRHRPPAG